MKECVITNRTGNALWIPDKLEGGEGKSPPGSAERGKERESMSWESHCVEKAAPGADLQQVCRPCISGVVGLQ